MAASRAEQFVARGQAAALLPGGSALEEADEEAAQRVPALGAVGLRWVSRGHRGGGRRGGPGGGQQAELRLGRRPARAAQAGAEWAALGAGVPPPPQLAQDLPPVLAAAGVVCGAAPRLSAVRAAPRRPTARRWPAAQPKLTGPRLRAQLPAASVLLRRGEAPRLHRLLGLPPRRGGGSP